MTGIKVTRRAAVAALTGAAIAPGLRAQSLPPAASDMSEARERRLLEGAKAEGEVVLYSSSPPDDNKAIIEPFQAKYGIPVKLWRASSEDILTRAVAEAKSGRPQVDIFLNTGMGLEPLHREKQLQPVQSPHVKDFMPEALPAHGEWVGFYLAPIVQAYNTNLVKKDDLPKDWPDLLHPRWQGKLAVEAADFDWFMLLVERMGREKGLALFREIAQKQKVSVRRGHSLLLNLVVAGEIPLGLTVYQFTAEQLKKNGAPIDWFTMGPSIAGQLGTAIPRAPRHPHAAMLLYDFVYSTGMDIMEKRNFVTARNSSVKAASFPIQAQVASYVLDRAQEWEELYRRTFGFK